MDDLVQIGLKDLAKLGFKGICDIEYKYDIRNNQWRLIEINPRVGMYFALCEFVGVNLIWNSYCDFIGRKDMLEKSRKQKDGLSWQYLSRDIPSVFQKILQHTAKKKDLKEFIWLNKKIEPILSYRDIICVAYYPFYIIQKIFQF
jgi:predicted ATP-grasp superfamily ATP-dependent carboligase